MAKEQTVDDVTATCTPRITKNHLTVELLVRSDEKKESSGGLAGFIDANVTFPMTAPIVESITATAGTSSFQVVESNVPSSTSAWITFLLPTHVSDIGSLVVTAIVKGRDGNARNFTFPLNIDEQVQSIDWQDAPTISPLMIVSGSLSKIKVSEVSQPDNTITNEMPPASSPEPPTPAAPPMPATKFRFSIYVSQPEKGVRTPFANGAVGHTWIGLYRSDTDRELLYGLYPSTPYEGLEFISGSYGEDRQGRVILEKVHEGSWDVKKTWEITEQQYRSILEFITRSHSSSPRYNLMTRNCTDFAIECGRAAGISNIPAAKSTAWPLDKIAEEGNWAIWLVVQKLKLSEDLPIINTNPGDMGEDLMQIGGVRGSQ